jgi:acetyltransferase-like isoleucine patch superfamily enzyme
MGPSVDRDDRGIHRSASIPKAANIHIDPTSFVGEGVIIRRDEGPVNIGPHAQIGPYSVIFAGGGVEIGARVMVGPHVTFASGNHDFRQLDDPMRFAVAVSRGPIVVGDDAWIGAGVCILDGIRVGRGAVVGAGAVVTKDVPDFAIAVGVPARVIGSRQIAPE